MGKRETEAQKEAARAAIRKHYYANRQYYIDKSARKRQVLRDLVHDIKSITRCADCNIQYPFYVTDFDHLSNKVANISRVTLSGSLAALERELLSVSLCAQIVTGGEPTAV